MSTEVLAWWFIGIAALLVKALPWLVGIGAVILAYKLGKRRK